MFAFLVVPIRMVPKKIMEDGVSFSSYRFVTERKYCHKEDNNVRKEVSWVECPYKHHQEDLVGLRKSRVFVEEKRALELIDLDQKTSQCRDASSC